MVKANAVKLLKTALEPILKGNSSRSSQKKRGPLTRSNSYLKLATPRTYTSGQNKV
jgi:hypothetical protein